MNRDSNKENFENQSPQRVTLIGRKRTFTGEYVGKFEDVSVYESARMGVGSNSAGIALPGRGIVVGKGAFSQNLALDLVRHEYGHILQAKMFGKLAFYSTIAPESVISAALNRKFGHSHNSYWTETHANYLSSKYFDAEYIDKTIKYPIRHLSYFNFIRLTLASVFLRYVILIAFLIYWLWWK